MTTFFFNANNLKSLLFYLILISTFFFPATLFSSLEKNIYYVRVDEKTSNGIIIKTNLLMIPANEEYRINGFKKITIRGNSDFNTTLDKKSAAEHNALCNLLINHGLKSVESKKTLINRNSHYEIVVSYEGVVVLPFNIIGQKYLDDGETYEIEMELKFAPITSPDNWSDLHFKNKIKNLIESFFSFFK